MWIICEYNFYLKLRCSYFFYLSVSVVYVFIISCVCLFVLPQESLRSFVFVFDAVVLKHMICMVDCKLISWVVFQNTKFAMHFWRTWAFSSIHLNQCRHATAHYLSHSGLFSRVSIALSKHSGELREFSTVTQTLDCVSGLNSPNSPSC